MLCVPAESPDGSSRPAQGTNPHKHKTEWDGVHQASLNSTPEACKCTRRHGKHTGWGGVVLQDQGAGSLQLCS